MTDRDIPPRSPVKESDAPSDKEREAPEQHGIGADEQWFEQWLDAGGLDAGGLDAGQAATTIDNDVSTGNTIRSSDGNVDEFETLEPPASVDALIRARARASVQAGTVMQTRAQGPSESGSDASLLTPGDGSYSLLERWGIAAMWRRYQWSLISGAGASVAGVMLFLIVFLPSPVPEQLQTTDVITTSHVGGNQGFADITVHDDRPAASARLHRPEPPDRGKLAAEMLDSATASEVPLPRTGTVIEEVVVTRPEARARQDVPASVSAAPLSEQEELQPQVADSALPELHAQCAWQRIANELEICSLAQQTFVRLVIDDQLPFAGQQAIGFMAQSGAARLESVQKKTTPVKEGSDFGPCPTVLRLDIATTEIDRIVPIQEAGVWLLRVHRKNPDDQAMVYVCKPEQARWQLRQ